MISVVIPTCHRNELLALCLDRLTPGMQTVSPETYEVIVTDDGRNSTAELMIRERYSWVRWMPGPRRGPAANRNHGASAARGEWLAFTDDDCLPQPGWLQSYIAAMPSGCEAFDGPILPEGDNSRDLSECPCNEKGGNFWSANMCMKADLFNQVGGFDETYPYPAHEDADFAIRVRTVTEPTIVPGAVVRHPVRILTLRQALEKVGWHARAWGHHAAKHAHDLGYTNQAVFITRTLYMNLRYAFASLRRGRPRSAIVFLGMAVIGTPIGAMTYGRSKRSLSTSEEHLQGILLSGDSNSAQS